jgi:nucleotide-binding universal stress UspA family protein
VGKIYIPVTGSPEGRKAYKKALSFAKDHNFDVVFIAVMNVELLNKLARYKIFIDEEVTLYQSTMEKDIEKYLNFMEKEAASIGVNSSHVVLKGEPYREILKDVFSTIERKLLLHAEFDILVIGEEV